MLPTSVDWFSLSIAVLLREAKGVLHRLPETVGDRDGYLFYYYYLGTCPCKIDFSESDLFLKPRLSTFSIDEDLRCLCKKSPTIPVFLLG